MYWLRILVLMLFVFCAHLMLIFLFIVFVNLAWMQHQKRVVTTMMMMMKTMRMTRNKYGGRVAIAICGYRLLIIWVNYPRVVLGKFRGY